MRVIDVPSSLRNEWFAYYRGTWQWINTDGVPIKSTQPVPVEPPNGWDNHDMVYGWVYTDVQNGSFVWFIDNRPVECRNHE